MTRTTGPRPAVPIAAAAPRERPGVAFAGAVLAVVTLATLILAVLAVGSAPAQAGPGAGLGAGPGVAVRGVAVRVSSLAPSGASVVPSGDSRVGGSPPGPDKGKPGWVWWGASALAAAFVAGGFRLWRHREFVVPEEESRQDDQY